ncbi:MAG: hypothetical protein H6740_14995 [Alphaproteobacteria bacterium]|nr:hypothetical protein [Alphaproteobacteria bacterium]
MLLLLLSLACDRGFSDPSREYGPPITGEADHPVIIHQRATLGGADLEQTDALGRPLAVDCGTCHGGESPIATSAGNPEAMHAELELRHGELSCASCHDEDRRYLHLADGERLEFDETMRLCAQCHGVQHRDYQRGSHGGMSGHWDLRQGPRLRNHCVDCHAAHDPSIKPVTPAPRTIDRGRDDQKEHH